MLLVSFISLPTHLPRVRVVAPAAALRATVPAASEGEATIAAATRIGSYPPPKDSDYIDRLCRGANGLFARTNFIPAVAEYVRLREEDGPQPLLPCASDALQSAEVRRALWERLTSPPCTPGLSRPVWLVIAASVPTALGWYGYYKFSVEEASGTCETRASSAARLAHQRPPPASCTGALPRRAPPLRPRHWLRWLRHALPVRWAA